MASLMMTGGKIGALIGRRRAFSIVSIGFDRIEDLDDAVPASEFEREPLPYEAGFVAGQAFLAYRKRGRPATSPRCSSVPRVRLRRSRGTSAHR